MLVKMLDETTWPDFERLAESQNGIRGGCWCMAFHSEGTGRGRTPEQNRKDKFDRVRTERAHAALVYDGDDCVGWCQFGPTRELPRIKNRKAYESTMSAPPDWRITCFYVHKGHRGHGVAAAALDGALQEIARLGGGTVESYPEDAEGRTPSSSFLHNGTAALFERHGFERTRQIGANHWVVTLVVKSDRPPPAVAR